MIPLRTTLSPREGFTEMRSTRYVAPAGGIGLTTPSRTVKDADAED